MTRRGGNTGRTGNPEFELAVEKVGNVASTPVDGIPVDNTRYLSEDN